MNEQGEKQLLEEIIKLAKQQVVTRIQECDDMMDFFKPGCEPYRVFSNRKKELEGKLQSIDGFESRVRLKN